MMLEAQSTLGSAFGAANPLAGFQRAGITIRERADIGCLLVNSAVETDDLYAALSSAAGVSLPEYAGEVQRNGNRLALWLTPRSWLLHCGLDEELTLARQINASFPDKSVHAAQFTDYLTWLELDGAGALLMLQEGGFLSLAKDGMRVGHAKRTLIAGITAVIVRQSVETWLVGVERSRARYFADWLRSCAEAS